MSIMIKSTTSNVTLFSEMVHNFANENSCFWLLDAIASYEDIFINDFYIVELSVNDQGKAELVISTDENEKIEIIKRQDFMRVNIKQNLKFYIISTDEYNFVIFTDEY